MNYLMDTSAWVEYFLGTERGETVKDTLENKANHVFALDSTIAEFYGWCLKNAQSFDVLFKIILSHSTLLPIHLPDWLKAMEKTIVMRKSIKKIGILDTLLMVKQEELQCTIVTTDSDFRTMKNVILL